ncbi:MAG: alternative ribosome rescue aminoacyl-tRNA hydrolase ArfB [Planctomycetota bacterium]
MNEPLVVTPDLTIPAGELRFSFARSAGPGGQNVNKVNTKAVLRWRPAESVDLPPAIRTRFLARYGKRLTVRGELVLASDSHRQRLRNVVACRERLRAMLLSVVAPPRRRRPTKPPRAANEARLKRKRQVAQKKQRRRSGFDE